ncbi:MAG: C40 family peptidase [Clostridia bacterium]|nr:C40 family peptidase [Clostridia bacterium]
MAFCYVFERPKAGDHSNRVTFAQMYYDRYKDMTGPSASVGDIELTGENKEKMQQMLQDAIRIANDNRYGYSQELRYSEFYYDCSSLVARLYTKHFGISMPSVTGDYHRFNAYNLGNPINVQLMPGDVLWRGQGTEGHVTLYIGNGNYVAAHSAKKPKPEQIDVYQDNPSKYMRVYRFIK